MGIHPTHYPFTPAPGLTRRRRRFPHHRSQRSGKSRTCQPRIEESAVSDCPQGVDILLGVDRGCRGVVCLMATQAVEKNKTEIKGWGVMGREETSAVLRRALGKDLHKASSLCFSTSLLVFSVRPFLVCFQSLSRAQFFETHGL